MAKALVIVESPAKAKTINKYLGRDFKVIASMGHVRDLPKSKLGVDVDADFVPDYVVLPDRAKVIKELKDAAKTADRVFVATDPDREGEAIGWHLVEELGAADKKKVQRLMFNEITKKAILEAVKQPVRDRHAHGRRAAGAPCARSARRLQDQPDPLGQGPSRTERRPRAVGRVEADLRSRTRHRSVHRRRVLARHGSAGRPRCHRSSTPGSSEGRRCREGPQRSRGQGDTGRPSNAPTSSSRPCR